MKLERWCKIFLPPVDPFTAPECAPVALHGIVFGDSRRVDGTEVTTSAIVSVKDGLVHTHSGSRYELGEPDPAFEAAYPNAKARLLEGK